MKAITLHRPWPYAIARLGKNIENRRWPAPSKLIGQHLAIHAGQKLDEAGVRWIHRNIIWAPAKLPEEAHAAGVIVATCTLAACVHIDSMEGRRIERENPWAAGPYLWILRRIHPLETPVAARGQQGLWEWEGSLL